MGAANSAFWLLRKTRDLHCTRLPIPNAQSIAKVSTDSSFRFCDGGAGGASPGMSGMSLLCGLTIWEKDRDLLRVAGVGKLAGNVKSRSRNNNIMVSQQRQKQCACMQWILQLLKTRCRTIYFPSKCCCFAMGHFISHYIAIRKLGRCSS